MKSPPISQRLGDARNGALSRKCDDNAGRDRKGGREDRDREGKLSREQKRSLRRDRHPFLSERTLDIELPVDRPTEMQV